MFAVDPWCGAGPRLAGGHWVPQGRHTEVGVTAWHWGQVVTVLLGYTGERRLLKNFALEFSDLPFSSINSRIRLSVPKCSQKEQTNVSQ